MSHFPIPQEDEGGQSKAITNDMGVVELLEQILSEIVKIRMFMGSIVEDEITEEDIECRS